MNDKLVSINVIFAAAGMLLWAHTAATVVFVGMHNFICHLYSGEIPDPDPRSPIAPRRVRLLFVFLLVASCVLTTLAILLSDGVPTVVLGRPGAFVAWLLNLQAGFASGLGVRFVLGGLSGGISFAAARRGIGQTMSLVWWVVGPAPLTLLIVGQFMGFLVR